MLSQNTDVIVVGGGAAGCMAAIAAARAGASVLLLEKNQKIGRKLYITGKGRCNLTNSCGQEEFLAHVTRNGRFLYGAISRFDPAAAMEFFESAGVPLKVERGNRVFPCSDRAADVIDALLREIRRKRVALEQETVTGLELRGGAAAGVVTKNGTFPCKAIILATGGISYPLTGSTGDGYRFAEKAGHTIVPPVPSLVPLETQEDFCRRLQGLSLRNVKLRVTNERGKTVYQEQGEMLFTHFGVSGPLVLSASAHMRDYSKERYLLHIDLKPALEEKTLDARLVRDLTAEPNRNFGHILEGLVPRAMTSVLAEATGIPETEKAFEVTKQQRRKLLETLKDLTVHVTGPRPVEEAIVTSGGVKVNEVDPRTMESKRVPGLFFAGELLDVDACTGGFNLQIAWATGKAAGEGAAAFCAGGGTEEKP